MNGQDHELNMLDHPKSPLLGLAFLFLHRYESKLSASVSPGTRELPIQGKVFFLLLYTEGCMGEQASLEFDLNFDDVLLHKLVHAY